MWIIADEKVKCCDRKVEFLAQALEMANWVHEVSHISNRFKTVFFMGTPEAVYISQDCPSFQQYIAGFALFYQI